jgi:hypothetical protein
MFDFLDHLIQELLDVMKRNLSRMVEITAGQSLAALTPASVIGTFAGVTSTESTTIGVFGVALRLFIDRLPPIQHHHGPLHCPIILAQELFNASTIPVRWLLLGGTVPDVSFGMTDSF